MKKLFYSFSFILITCAVCSGQVMVSVSAGTNFDLADKVKANSFYGHLSAFHPSVIGRFGFYGSIYQNKYVSSESTTDEAEYLKTLSFYNSDSVYINRISARRKATAEYNNYGFTASALWTFYSERDTVRDTYTYLSYVFDFEEVLRRETTSFTYETSASDTLSYPRSFISSDTYMNEKYIESVAADFYDKYFSPLTFQLSSKGRPIPMGADTAHVTAYIKVTPFGFYWQHGGNKPKPYYSAFFYVKESILGIRIGGEVKAFWSEKTSFFNLFLTKTFSLPEFAKGLKANS